MGVPSIYLSDWLDLAHVQAPGPSHVQIQTFVIRRVAQTVVFQHPPSGIEWPEMQLGDAPRLKTSLGIKPYAWERISGPVVFRATVRDAEGRQTVVLERTLDARCREEDRNWVPVDVGLESWRGQQVKLVFETAGAPGPPAYGWAGWGSPELLDATEPGGLPRAPSTVPMTVSRDRPDVILVTCDALRKDHLGCYGAPSGTTPNLDALAAESLQILHARSASDATLASVVSLLTGRLPHETGVFSEWGEFPAHLPSLPVVLAGAGYHTVLASSELELGAAEAGIGRLFAESIPCLGNPSQHSSMTMRRLNRRLRATDASRSLFVWAQLFEPHPPSVPESQYIPAFAGDPEQEFEPEAVRAIHGIESALELARCRKRLAEGVVPPGLLHRLEETVRTLRGDRKHGPDLASHLRALGARAWKNMELREFLRWLALELGQVRSAGGRASGALLSWLREIDVMLADVESDLLSWLDGVQNFRYPVAMYAAAVTSADDAVGRLVRTLKELGRYDEALIVFTAPHGEHLYEPPQTFEHHALHEIALHVPLLIKFPRSLAVPPAKVSAPVQLDHLAATLLDYLAVPGTGAFSRERSRRGAFAGGVEPERSVSGVSESMQGLAACLYRPPFKLVRFHADGMTWPWFEGRVFARGETVLLEGDREVRDDEDRRAQQPDVAAHLEAELERLAPLAAFEFPPLSPARFETRDHPADAASSIAPEKSTPAKRPVARLSPLREGELPDSLKPGEVARLVALEVHQALLEQELRDAEERRSGAERAHRLDASKLRELTSESKALRRDLKQLVRWLEQLEGGVAKLYRTRRWRLGSWLRQFRKGGKERDEFPAIDAILRRFARWREGAAGEVAPADPNHTMYLRWLRAQRPSPKRLAALSAEVGRGPARPRFGLSMVIPPEADPDRVKEAIASVLAQSYGEWRLYLQAGTRDVPPDLMKDPRIEFVSSSELPSMVTHLAAMGAEDQLEPHALLEVASHLGRERSHPDLVYTDEDELEDGGLSANPFFKPAWSPDTLESGNYVGALALYDRRFLKELAADLTWLVPERAFELVLRAAEQPAFRVDRLPRLLYHRRTQAERSRVRLREAERLALADAMERRREVADVALQPGTGRFRVQRSVWKQEKVAILIPTRDRLPLLRRAVESVVEKTTYRNFEIVIINNESRDPATLAWLAECGHRVFDFPGPFNYAAMHNAAIRAVDAPWLLLLNNDTEVIKGEWLTAMAEHVQRPEIGAVGARLLFPDGTIQHSGVVLGIQGRASHAFANLSPDDVSAHAQLQMVRNYSAVTAACMMMRREVYEKIGGMDAQRFAVAYNDVELCVRALRHGYRNLVTPYAVLKHHECASRPRRDFPGEVEHLRATCLGPEGWSDPYYHPALNRQEADFSLAARV